VGDDGTIYFGSDDEKVYALSPNGQLIWAFNAGGDVRASPAVGATASSTWARSTT
jgi:outer membrane protein assembly factor BamB